MAKTSSALLPASAYERIGKRVQKLITDPRVQKLQTITVSRLETEPEEDWDRFIGDMESTDGVTISTNDDGSLKIGWSAYIDA